MSDIVPTFCGLTAKEIQELKQRNAELSAQVKQLRSAIKNTINKWEGVTELESTLYVLMRFYNKTSEQCLAEIKAQAATEFLAEIKRHLSKTFIPINSVENTLNVVIVDAHATFVHKLRQQAKEE